MSKVLTGTVSVRNPDTGEQRTFGPGSKPPASWAKLITNPRAWDDEPTTPEPEEEEEATSTGAATTTGGSGDGAASNEPARNASTETWRTFAKDEFEVEFGEDATRSEIIAALEERELIKASDS